MNFSINRFSKLLKRDWLVFKKPLGYGFLAMFILLMGIIIINAVSNEHESLRISFWTSVFNVFFVVGGTILTSIIYWEFRNPAGRINYLSIPASHLEKVLSRGLYTLILYPLALTIVFFICYKLTEILDDPTVWDMPLNDIVKYTVISCLFVHPIIFMFAIWINKYVAPKAALVSLVTALVVAFIGVLFFRVIFHGQFDGLEMSGQFRIDPKEGFQEEVGRFWYPFIRNTIMIFSMVLFWTVSYFKMKEKEI